MRLYLALGRAALAPETVQPFFDAAFPHYEASGNGLRDAPSAEESCEYLVVEDFGTTGLIGDPEEADPPASGGKKNAFYLFFRAEGLSGKSGISLGRWGVGKFVFPRSSRASTHFGLTVRHDDGRRLLCGAITLKAHRINGMEDVYTPDGMFGLIGDDGLVLPVEAASMLDSFSSIFSISRKNEPGLSVVIPWVDRDITFESLLAAVVNDYFYPILHDQLVVELVSGDERVSIDRTTLDSVLGQWKMELGEKPIGVVELARFAANYPVEKRLELKEHPINQSPKWVDDLLSSQQIDQIRSLLAAGNTVALRVPVHVRPKGSAPSRSHFDVFLKADKAADGRPLFVREGITISDLKTKRAREIRSLVVVEEEKLAALLGDSENPAHTQWQKDSSNFKGKYTFGPGVIDFVTQSVGEIIAIVHRKSTEQDTSLTLDVFSLARPEEPSPEPPASAPQVKTSGKPPIPSLPPSPTFVIQRVPGGFDVRPLHHRVYPLTAQIQCAYNTSSGNPLKKWHRADFQLTDQAISVKTNDCGRVSAIKGNEITVEIGGADFSLKVSGFDTNRDVFVRVVVMEARDDDSEA